MIRLSNVFVVLLMLVNGASFALSNSISVPPSCNAGADNTATVFCLDEAKTKFKSVNDAKNFYLSLLEPEIAKNGSFKPSIDRLAINYNNNPIGTFKTTYTVTVGDCSDSAVLSLKIVANPNAGPDNIDNTYCSAQIEELIQSPEDARNLYISFLSSDIATDGTFNPSIDQILTQYNQNPIGTFQTTYTVRNGVACEDSAQLAITINESGNAGEDNVNNILCKTSVDAQFTSVPAARDYYLSLLDLGVKRTGSFNPSIDRLAIDYNNNPYGTFTTIYTVGDDGCKDSATLSLTVVRDPNAGMDNVNNEFCYTDISSTLSNLNSATTYYMGLVASGADSNGIFSPSIQTLVNNFNLNPTGNFQTEYIVTAGGCEDRAILSVNVKDGSYAGRDNTNNVLTRSESKERFKSVADARAYYLGLLDAGVLKNGSFRPSIDRLAINYNKNNIGTFKTTYTVTSNGCSDSVELSLTIVEDSPQTRSQASTLNTQYSTPINSSSLSVYDFSGRMVKTSQVNATETFNSNSSSFSDSNLTKGIYIYKLNDGNGFISTKKIVVK